MGSLNSLLQASPRALSPRSAAPTRGRAATRIALILCIAAVPLGASSAQTSPAQVTADAAALPFAAHFEGVVEPLASDLRDVDPRAPATAVDLDSFDPPIEEVPKTQVLRNLGAGVASYYGRRFHGRRTANGERFNMRAMTAAHKTLPFGTMVRVTNTRNGRAVTVRINDRGPFIPGRTIDLSRGAAEQIGLISTGHARVELELIAP